MTVEHPSFSVFCVDDFMTRFYDYLNVNSLEFSFIFAMLRYISNVATRHNSALSLAM